MKNWSIFYQKNFENKTLSYRKWKSIFDLCVQWYRDVIMDLYEIACIKETKAGAYTQSLSDGKGKVSYRVYISDEGLLVKAIQSFSFNTYTKNKVTLLCQKMKDKQTINEDKGLLGNILNFMKRLDKVK